MSLLDMVFGCWHQRRSFPVTVRGKQRRSIAAASVTKDIRGLPRLRPRVPVRLVADEDARVRATHCVGGSARHYRSRSQGGLRLGAGPFAKTHLCIRSGEQSGVPGRATEVLPFN